jgi:serine/threonine protein phosphatase 1
VRDSLLWIRDDFLETEADLGAVVVHGTIRPEVDMRHNRIGIDTGAYLHGVLTALYLEGGKREVLQVGRATA